MSRLGFIGVGAMGGLMCRRLLESGHHVSVQDVQNSAVEAMVEAGAIAQGSPAAVARNCDYILLSLPNAAIIDEVVFGENGILKGIQAGSVLIDLSSSTPAMTKKVGKAVEGLGASMLDTPVSRGAAAAAQGTLSIMVGGKQSVYKGCEFILKQLGTDIIYVGDLGSAHALKSLNNLLSATNLLAALEGVIIADKAGVSPEKLIAAVNLSSGRSHMTTVRFPKYYLPRKFNSNFTLGLMYKDCSIALEMAQQLATPMLFSSITQHIYAIGVASGMAGEDNTKIMMVMENLIGHTVGSESNPSDAMRAVES